MKKRVLVIGNTNMNLNVQVSSIPEPGKIAKMSQQFDYTAGGSGTCAVVAFNKIGCDTIYSTRLGNDLNGQRLLSFFNDIKVDTRFIKCCKGFKTGFEVSIKESDGDIRRLVCSGINEIIDDSYIEEAFTCYPDGVYTKCDIGDRTLVAASEYAYENKSKLFINISGAKLSSTFLGETDNAEVLIINEESLCDMTGIYPQDLEKCLKACISLSSKIKAGYYIVRLKKRGTFIYDGKYYSVIAPYNMPTVDVSAAEDTFDAAFVSKYLECNDIKQAVKYAHIAFALCASKEGLYTSVPTEAEINDFIKNNNTEFGEN